MRKPQRWSVVVGAALTLALGAAAPAGATAPPPARAESPASTESTPAAASVLRVPAGWAASRDALAARTGVERAPVTEVVAEAINPADYECAPTRLTTYVRGLLAGLDQAQLTFLLESGVLDFPAYDALFFGTSGDPRYAIPREYRQELRTSFADGRRFWDVESGDIQLMAMPAKGVLQDPARLARLLELGYGLSAQDAAAYARYVVAVVAQIPELQGGTNPIFTLNAYAFTAEGESHPVIASLPDKIVMGEGILEFFEYLGYADVGPRVVLAHEFGHHVQFENDLFDSPLTGPEATRRTELMADAYATYFAAHKRGLALNAKRVVSAEQSFYVVGDCQFDQPGHHGTPLQRERAAQWGADLAAAAQKQGHVLPSMTVARAFDAALPELVAPDAP